ncbi:MAG: AIPR family protein, partial [Lachnospiraceae bacterium]|nr:AIPR family protein [Candidatus Minthocola equi]
MYEQIKNEISTEYYKNNYPNDGQRFIAWYLRNIHNLDTFEAKECITDGAGDKQIDAVYIDNQACTIYIIQGKFYSGDTVNAEPLREVLSSWIQIKDLAALQDGANGKLRMKISEISLALEDEYEVCFELITTSSLTEAAQNDLTIFQNQISDDDSINASISVIDSAALAFKYDEALNKNRPYINHEFKLEEGKFMELMIGDTKAVIVALPLKDCITIPGIKDGSLFRKNVRQSLGTSNKVNKGIAHTIKKDTGDFFFLHNGITAICSKMSINNTGMFLDGKLEAHLKEIG